MGNQAQINAQGCRDVAVDVQIKRFARSFRKRLRKLISTSSRVGDLLYVFPGAAFAIVSGHGTHDQRGRAVRAVRDGAGLRDVAEILDIPVWLRKLPPEAFGESLVGLPNGQKVGREIVNFIPEDADLAAAWLQWVRLGNVGCSERFALWTANKRDVLSMNSQFAPVLPLAAFAWYSAHADLPASRWMERRWNKGMKFAAAVAAASVWFERILRDVTGQEVPRRGPGRYSRRKGGHFQFVRLTSQADLVEEGRQMNHCVADYYGLVSRGQSLIFSIRRNNRRIATLELRWGNTPVGQRLCVNQLYGHSNTAVAPDVRTAVAQWLAANGGMTTINNMSGEVDFNQARWERIWQPYIEARGNNPAPFDLTGGNALTYVCRDLTLLNQQVAAA